MKLVLDINLDNAAFEHAPDDEFTQIFHGIAGDLAGRNLHEFGREPIFDTNGNRIGHVQILDTEDF